jgi:hypothetical protein
MVSEPLGANDAGGTSRLRRSYQIALTLLPIAGLARGRQAEQE